MTREQRLIKASKRLLWFCLALFMALQTAMLSFSQLAQAQTVESQDTNLSASIDVSSEDSAVSYNQLFNSWTDLNWVYNINSTALEMSAEDRNAVDQGQVDYRVTQYLIDLVTPVELGGQGLDHIKASRIFKNYSSTGVGKYDRETLNATEEDNSLVSAHNSGQAVDISEVGTVTCKIVEHRYVGGDTTKWQAPISVKVAWQSKDGIANSPTPTGQSLMETSSTLTANAMMQYLNSSGEMDQVASYIKGLDMPTILTYVGSNILLKTVADAKLTSDPLANSLIFVLGTSVLEKKLPDLNGELTTGSSTDDARVAMAKARIEQSLNLPAGSLRTGGWQNILDSTGKRLLEKSLGLPSLYFENKTLDQALSNETIVAALKSYTNKDSAFNTPQGTIDMILNKNNQGFALAGVNIIAGALKMNDQQKQLLLTAAKASQTPAISFDALPSSDQISSQDLGLFFAPDASSQTQANDALKKLGLNYLQEAVKKVVPQQYGGISQAILDKLTGNQTYSLGDLATQLGSTALASQAGVNVGDLGKVANASDATVNNLIASYLNKELSLGNSSSISGTDIKSIVNNQDYTIFQKIGGAEADKAIGWNNGTGYDVISGKVKIEDAYQQVFANKFGQLLGLNSKSVSLTGDIVRNYGDAIIEERLGLNTGDFSSNPSVQDLAGKIGSDKFQRIFGVDSSNLSSVDWANGNNNQQWLTIDVTLGVSPGTTKTYLQGQTDGAALSKNTGNSNVSNLALQKVWDQFGLNDTLKLDDKAGINLLNFIRGGDNLTIDQKNQAIQSIYKILGRSVDNQAGFANDAIYTFLTSDTQAKTTMFLEQGARLLVKSLGSSISDLTDSQINSITDSLVKLYSTRDTSPFFAQMQNTVADYVIKATGIPAEFRDDAKAFTTGDIRTGLAATSFTLWQKYVNQYLPADGQLTYQELRNTIIFGDTTAIKAKADQIIAQAGLKNIGSDIYQSMLDLARKNIMEEAEKIAEYKISDSFLRKVDMAIPAGFSKIMFTGTDKERAQMLESYAFGKIDTILQSVSPGYVLGTFQKIYDGTLSSDQADTLVGSIIHRSGISFGNISSDFLANMYEFAKAGNKGDFYTNAKYSGMWSYFDVWIQQNIGISLPDGITKSIYYASQHGWNFDGGLKDANGNTVVASVNSLGENLLYSQLTSWADKQFGLPAGTIYRTYQAIQAINNASTALDIAKAAGDAAGYAKASANLSKAQASLTLFIITTALNYCDACQKLFGSVDQALAAPPGFTNAAVAGAIAMSLGLGPAGLIMAAAIYLFGVNSVSYLCPTPPQDPYAVTSFDKSYDQSDYGYAYDSTTSPPVKSSPKLGTQYFGKFAENPFDWDNDVQFSDGNNSALWMAWARYYTGKLLDSTVKYATDQNSVDKPLQILTLRQSNVEFFLGTREETFGTDETTNPRVGMGYTQDSTKIADSVHVSFGGFF